MMPIIYLYLYCKIDSEGAIEAVRAYKYTRSQKDTTPQASHFLYSHKTERYHEANLYFMDWKGKQINQPEGLTLKAIRPAIQRIGLDLR